MQTGDTHYIYRNKLDKACFQHMAYGNYKDLAKRTESDKILRNKTFKIAINPRYDGSQRGLVTMIYRFFDKKSAASGAESTPIQQLPDELHKSIIRRFKKNAKSILLLKTIFGLLILLIYS